MSYKVLFRNILSVGIIQICNYLFPLISVPIISRIIGPEKFGVINFAGAFVGYFILLIGYGFDLTATRKIARDPNNQENTNRTFSEVFQTQVLLLIVSTIIFTFLLFTIPQLKAEKTVAIFSFLLCLSTVTTQNWIFQAMQEMPKVAILSFISKILFTIFILLLIHKKADYIWQPLVFSICSLLISVYSFFWSIKRYHIKLEFVEWKTCLKLLWHERMFFLSMIVINFYTNTNIVLLGLFRNAVDVGFYTAGQRLISIFQSILSMTLAQAFFPFIGKAFGESHEKGLNAAQKILPLILFFTTVFSLALYIVGPFAIQLLYGPTFKPAIQVFNILVFSPVIISFSTVLGIHVMMNLQMDKMFFRVSCIGAVISISLNLLFVPKFGYIASAAILLLTELTIAVSFHIILKLKHVEIINKNYFHPKGLFELSSSIIKRKKTLPVNADV